LKTWLYRIAIREALNHKRWFKRHLQKNVSIDAEPEEGRAHIEIEDHGATPFEQLAAWKFKWRCAAPCSRFLMSFAAP